ncbi:MAG: preprotein translocase subunit SecG [Capnocytophaga sp.]|nr:preprotein translocase subunit SecG [Capnocytophaga sp.]
MVTFNILLVVVLLITFLLILVIMVQQPKGGGLSSSFGGNAQVVGGVKKTGDFLDRSTWVLGTSLIVVILLANIVLKNNKAEVGGGSVFDGVKPAQTTAPIPTPETK